MTKNKFDVRITDAIEEVEKRGFDVKITKFDLGYTVTIKKQNSVRKEINYDCYGDDAVECYLVGFLNGLETEEK